jgi:class 3 adenylate cyclase
VRPIRFHNPETISLRDDLAVLFVTPSINDNDFHRWLRDTFRTEVLIGPKETRIVEIDARQGWHNVFAPQVHALSYLVARPEGASEVNLELFDGQMLPEQVEIKTGPVRVSVHNNLDAKQVLGVGFLGDDNDEHVQANFRIEPFLTGKRLLTNQTFRSLFKAETVEVGTGLQVRNLSVLFTDLQASTAMYERVGDMNALGIVRRHFEVLEQAVARHRGAVVKTIGDAVMAVFAEPDQAMGAATEMIETVRRAVSHGEDLVLKIGLHQGPCVAIQSNNQIDYFGRTVNIAARVQSLAEGGQIVCSEEVWNAPGVQAVIEGRNLNTKRETAELKGIEARYPVRRVFVTGVAATRPARVPARKAAARRPAPRKTAARKGALKRRKAG